MFAVFCWSKGITCRLVEIMNEGDHHVLNEFYDEENKRWVMIDVMNNLLSVKSVNGQLLNLVDFMGMVNKPSPLFAIKAASDSLAIGPIDSNADYLKRYYKKQNPIHYYFRADTRQIYSFSSKLRRYFLPVSWYNIYDKNGQSNALFYLKLFCFVVWLALLPIVLWLQIKRKKIKNLPIEIKI
ncbi:MAG: hypothetical protein M3342_10775 [Bacteroidota bacterium]|nr:hypothetical protein [Bacteroidota bacterium]